MSLDNLSVEDQKKLNEFVDKGVAVLQEIADLRDSLKDTAKNLAEMWDVKPTVLMKSLNAAFKSTLDAQKEEVNQVETILQITKRI